MINPIQSFKEMPARKKVATVVGAAAAAGAVAAGTAAFIKGGNADAFQKLGEDTKAFTKFKTRMAAGFKEIASLFSRRGAKVTEEAEKVAAEATEAVEKTEA